MEDIAQLGRLPGAFEHPSLGFVDAVILHKMLDQNDLAGWIRTAAHPEQVLISSGHAIPRPAAHHLALSYHKHQYDWTKDTEDELVEVLQVTKRSFRAIYIYK